MAKAGKISKDVLAEFSTEKNKRPFGNIPPRRYYLIACEGEETETNYFEAIKRILPPAMVSRVSITGTGRNTRSLVDYTQKLVDARRKSSALPPYYKIWVVFDRDSFEPSDFDNAISMIESKSTDTEQWQAAWSNGRRLGAMRLLNFGISFIICPNPEEQNIDRSIRTYWRS